MRKKKQIISFSPQVPHLLSENTSPYWNSQSIPEWWRDLPHSQESMRRCPGVLDYIQSGITIPMWADLNFVFENDGLHINYDIDNPSFCFDIDDFNYDQTGDIALCNGNRTRSLSFIKISVPWTVATPKGWSCLVLPHIWSKESNYQIMPGIVNTDYYHHINAVVNITTDSNFKINYKSPLLHIIPFKRKFNLSMEITDNAKFFIKTELGFGRIFRPKNTKGLYKAQQRIMDSDDVC